MQPNILTARCRPPASETIHGAVDPFPASVRDVGIHHPRLHVPMAEEFLNRADVIAIFHFKHRRGE
jgi:hypothetical protein